MAITGTGFFKTSVVQTKDKAGFSYIPVGKQFDAVAIAFIDYFNRTSRYNEDTIKRILEPLLKYSSSTITKRCITPSEKMDLLFKNPHKSELVRNLAYVLLQIVVDEIYSNANEYRDVFEDLNANTPQSHLRQATIELPPRALRAISNSLKLSLALIYTGHDKELRKRELFFTNSKHPAHPDLVIQIMDGHYSAQVKNKMDFAHLVLSNHPFEDESTDETTLAEIFALLAEEDGRLLQSFEGHRHRLRSMVDCGELDKKGLLDLYSKGPFHDNPTTTLEFYEQLNHQRHKPVSHETSVHFDRQLMQRLIDHIAARISNNEQEANALFEYGEEIARPVKPSKTSLRFGLSSPPTQGWPASVVMTQHAFQTLQKSLLLHPFIISKFRHVITN